MRVRLRNVLLLPCAACLAFSLAACGEDDAATQGSGSTGSASQSRVDHGDGHMHGGGGAHMTQAYVLDGELRTGSFQALTGAPRAASQIGGRAWVAEDGEGTTATVEVTGLRPGVEYVGHLHAQPCSQDEGGPHFAFNPRGPEEPPNEVHFGFVADHHGSGAATVRNPRRVGSGARSVVVHDAKSEDRLVCADLRPATQAQVRQATGADASSKNVGNALTVDVQIRDGKVTPAGDRVEAKVGQPIRLEVDSDQADQIHVHSTPEHEFAVKPTGGQTFEFTVNRPGVYEVESHETGTVIVSVAVTP
ncbi:MAG: hypothetical protein ACRDUV_23280 [Pseudonocardiaceae bacterium]